MTATLHQLPLPVYPEHLAPVFDWPAVGGPLNSTNPNARAREPQRDLEKMFEDIRSGLAWAEAANIRVISFDGDRNGAYLRLVASPRLRGLFGDECTMVKRQEKNGLRTEIWLGCIGHIRVFWREVTCVH